LLLRTALLPGTGLGLPRPEMGPRRPTAQSSDGLGAWIDRLTEGRSDSASGETALSACTRAKGVAPLGVGVSEGLATADGSASSSSALLSAAPAVGANSSRSREPEGARRNRAASPAGALEALSEGASAVSSAAAAKVSGLACSKADEGELANGGSSPASASGCVYVAAGRWGAVVAGPASEAAVGLVAKRPRVAAGASRGRLAPRTAGPP